MSQINALIRELCPSGVEFKPLGDLLTYEQPTKYLVSSEAYDDSYATPVLTAGQTFILGHTDEETGIYQASRIAPVVIFDDFTAASQWVDFPFKAKSSAMKMLTPKPGLAVDLRFLFFAMQTITYRPQEHARQWIKTYSTFRVPLPPIAVQREVVRVLDLYQSAQEALQEELQKELIARRQQYGHYLDSLLSFTAAKDVFWRQLSEIGEVFRGRRFLKSDYVEKGIGAVHYGQLYTHFNTKAVEVITRVREDLRPTLRFVKPGDVIIAEVGETVEDVGKAIAWLGKEDVAIHDGCYGLRHDMDPVFIAYCLQTRAFHREKNRHVARAKMKRLSLEGLRQLRIPVPPRDVQQEIVRTLDLFESVKSQLETEILGEVSARRPQYEHYRDRLLTFQESVA